MTLAIIITAGVLVVLSGALWFMEGVAFHTKEPRVPSAILRQEEAREQVLIETARQAVIREHLQESIDNPDSYSAALMRSFGKETTEAFSADLVRRQIAEEVRQLHPEIGRGREVAESEVYRAAADDQIYMHDGRLIYPHRVRRF